jgi:hypothetical protein
MGGVGVEDLGAPTINVRKRKTSTVNPLGGAGAEDPGASTTNTKKRRRRPPWEALEIEIWERPPSMLENVDGGSLGRC